MSEQVCLCSHDEEHHRPSCEALYQTKAGMDFCPCTGFRGSKPTLPPKMRVMLRLVFEDSWMPDWTKDANCRSAQLGGVGAQTVGQLYRADGRQVSPAFCDDIGPDDPITDMPEASAQAFQRDACAPCPVRRECLTYAYEEADNSPRYGILGGVDGATRTRFQDFPDRIEQGLAWFTALAIEKGWVTWTESKTA